MKLQRITTILALATLACGVAAGSMWAADADDAMPKDRAALDAYMREFILKNPQVVREALLSLEQAEQVKQTKQVLGSLKGELYGAGSPVIGNAAGKVKIVEFFDYNCGYCRAVYPKLKAFLAANPDTGLVLKDVASFGADSEAVARLALAANLQGKFASFNDALMEQKGKLNEARALELAGKLGLDITKLKSDAQSDKTTALLGQTRELADRVNASVTPLFIIGHNGISGAPEDLEAQLTQHVGEIRKSGCEVC